MGPSLCVTVSGTRRTVDPEGRNDTVDFDKLTNADKVVAGGFLAFFISLFLPWFKLDFGGFGSATASGWDVDFMWSTLPFLLGLIMVAQIALDRFSSVELPEIPVTWGQVHLGLGSLTAFLVVVKLLIGEDVIDRSWGLFVAAIAAGAMAAGGFLKFQEDGAGGGASAGGSSAPPQAF